MIEKQTTKVFAQLIRALSMQAENMQRQFLGQSMAYGEEQFKEIIDEINNLIIT